MSSTRKIFIFAEQTWQPCWFRKLLIGLSLSHTHNIHHAFTPSKRELFVYHFVFVYKINKK